LPTPALPPHAVTGAFQREHACPSTGETTGVPLAYGGPDAVSNLQWQTTRYARQRTRGSERLAFASAQTQTEDFILIVLAGLDPTIHESRHTPCRFPWISGTRPGKSIRLGIESSECI
jgi:hypothetical protein